MLAAAPEIYFEFVGRSGSVLAVTHGNVILIAFGDCFRYDFPPRNQ